MKGNGKHIAKEATNGIIYDSAGQITHNGLLEICPFCGEMNNHFGSGGSVNIWTVGAIERRECTKCRKQFHKISVHVEAGRGADRAGRQRQSGGGLNPRRRENWIKKNRPAFAWESRREAGSADENISAINLPLVYQKRRKKSTNNAVFARRGGLVMGINVPAISLVTHDNRTGKKDTPYPVFFLPA